MDAHSQSAREPVLFTMERLSDSTGVSGTGRVLDGVVFHTGQVVICWRTDLRQPTGHSSLAVYPTVEAFIGVHLLPHDTAASRITLLHGMNEELAPYA